MTRKKTSPSTTNSPPCSVEACVHPGEYKAPRSRESLDEYIWFCLEHIRERNKSWNYFDGMEEPQIEAFIKDAVTGHRPTWSRESRLRQHYFTLQDALYEFMHGTKPASPAQPRIPAKIRKALAAMEMEHPYTLPQLKTRYRQLVKKYHPDTNKGDKKLEEKFKQITTAYKTLQEQLTTTSNQKGFTLIELSIALIIVGLIIGGILVGKDLIESAQMRAQIKQFEELNTATLAFKLKYNCVAGDCPHIGSYLTLPGCSSAGNGDGFIRASAASSYQGGFNGESMGYYNELNLSNFYPASFVVTACGLGSGGGIIGRNIQAAKIGSGGFITTAIETRNGHFWGINQSFDIALHNGYQSSIFTISSSGKGVITPSQAYIFDKKIDDGMPVTGKVVAARVWGGDNALHRLHESGYVTNSCTQNTSPISYNTSYSSNTPNVCNLFLYTPF